MAKNSNKQGNKKKYYSGSKKNFRSQETDSGASKIRSESKAKYFVNEQDKSRTSFTHRGALENDPTYYYSREEFIKPFANLAFNNMNGLETNGFPSLIGEDSTGTRMAAYSTSHSVPGIMTIDFVPIAGYSDKATSALNVASLKNYAFIRHENSGSTNYDAANMMQYNMAVLGLIPAFRHVRRALTSIGLYSENNRYSPDAIIRAMGFDPAYLRNNISNLIGRYNLLTTKFNKFAIPYGFKHILRWEFLTDNIFTDRDTNKAQLYMFKPTSYTYYQEVGTDSGLPEVRLEPINAGFVSDKVTYPANIGSVMDKLEAALDQLYTSNSIGVMSGDVLKAYGMDNLYKLSPITSQDVTTPVYSETALWQIHNCQTVPVVTFGSQTTNKLISITDINGSLGMCRMQEIINADDATSYIDFSIALTSTQEMTQDSREFSAFAASYLGSASLCDLDRNNPAFTDVIEITRAKTLSTKWKDGGTYLDSSATEIYTGFSLWNDATSVFPSFVFTNFWNRSNNTSAESSQIDAILSILTAFDWSPAIYAVLNPVDKSIQAERLVSELDNSRYINASDLKALNNAVLQHVFGTLD